MVSGHPSALYDEMLAGWRSLALQVTTQAQVRTEVVWFNFAPDRVHWAELRRPELHRPPAHQA